jgi:protoheme IX farnesyltransferase
MVGFELARHGSLAWGLFASVAVATWLQAAGAAALNMAMESPWDGLMHRTCERPIPTGRVSRAGAAFFGLALCFIGLALMLGQGKGLGALVGLATIVSYLLFYTPLKRVSSLSIIVGAVPGALPPVMGWVAASGKLEAGSLCLFGILFLWQIPHFLSIGWLYREDYLRGGFQVMPGTGPMGAARQMILYAVALIPMSLAPSLIGLTGAAYFYGAVVLGSLFALVSLAAAYGAQASQARRVLLASVTYLPFLQGLMLFDKIR